MIGCGRIGERHAINMGRYGKLLAVCDIDKKKADRFASEYEATAYYSIENFLESGIFTDLVAVCTPNGLHADHSILILNAGMNVLCEKPMAITVTDCHRMIAAAADSAGNLCIVKQNRFNPPLIKLKELLDENRLGNIYSLQINCFWNRDADYYKESWRGTKSLDGGTLFTQFSHFIDIIYWLIGDISKTSAVIRNYAHGKLIEFEDTGMVILEFKNGVTGTLNYTVNSFGKNMEGSITLFGEKGTVKVGGQYLNKIEYQEIENYRIPELENGRPANDYGSYQGSMSNHDKVYENLLGYLKNGEGLYMNTLEALKTVEIIENIYRNAR